MQRWRTSTHCIYVLYVLVEKIQEEALTSVFQLKLKSSVPDHFRERKWISNSIDYQLNTVFPFIYRPTKTKKSFIYVFMCFSRNDARHFQT